jgi:hypothetical protein
MVPIQRASRRDPLHRQRQAPRASLPPISVPAYNPARHLTRARMMWRGVRGSVRRCARAAGERRGVRGRRRGGLPGVQQGPPRVPRAPRPQWRREHLSSQFSSGHLTLLGVFVFFLLRASPSKSVISKT